MPDLEFGRFALDQGRNENDGGTKLRLFMGAEELAKEKQQLGMRIPVFFPLTGYPARTWADFFEQERDLKFSSYREAANGNIELDFKTARFKGSITLFSASNPSVIRSSRIRNGLQAVTTSEPHPAAGRSRGRDAAV